MEKAFRLERRWRGSVSTGLEASHTSLPERLLHVLEGLLRIPAGNLHSTLSHASDLLAGASGADKIDVFLYDPERDSLVALGTSNQSLSALQRKLGLDVLPLSNGGRGVAVFKSGEAFMSGRIDEDPEELRGVKEALAVRSFVGVPLEIAGKRQGVLMLTALQRDFFSAEDLRMAESAARWVGIVAHRAELVEEIGRNAVEQGRRMGAEELVTVLAHDLRNYLAPLDLRVEMLRMRAAREARSEELRDIEALARSLDRLEALVSDILDVARLDHGLFPVARTPVDLGSVVEEIAGAFSTPQNPVQANLQQGERIVVAADRAALRQCLENLIANAIQKSPRAAPVSVFVKRETQARGDAWARVEVVDEGPGIAPELLPHVFERFVSGHRREGGLGLGLYLAKRIAAFYGGDLGVESSPGKGARFTLSLPVSPGKT